jgi:hypothetical protein
MKPRLKLWHKECTAGRWHIVYHLDLGNGFLSEYAGLVYVGSPDPTTVRKFLIRWVKGESKIEPHTYLFKGKLDTQ